MKTSDIITHILDAEGVNPSAFAKQIGVKPTQIYDLKSGKTKGISLNMANKIVTRYPKYSKGWLRGADITPKITITPTPINMAKKDTNVDTVTISREAWDTIRDQASAIRLMMEERAQLRQELAEAKAERRAVSVVPAGVRDPQNPPPLRNESK